MEIYPVTQNAFSRALDLLKKNNLPTEDITDTAKLFVMHEANEVTGVIGFESYGVDGLLRSLCVSESRRKSGMGAELVDFIEKFAATQGVKNIYLLTTTASGFFQKRAYQQVERNNVPEAIQKTAEFTSLCPSGATVMRKSLK